ncbi:uncharacterized protein KGF55_000176 [Candida pseudojiufengensis]|uniref:uncharacterized protein n=1 Tax=Candida pseudojiufengensis TaxID=497109 RepID=UPI002224DD1A|nr:uncharacterized protein KGF55_000176 [Candida pseudojiufengensis]KAI5966767.1 hypothetical protein KGF55_000176 [Candida pseudojiufengensis]
MTNNLTSNAYKDLIDPTFEYEKSSNTVDSNANIEQLVERLTITDNNEKKESFKLTELPSEIILNITNNLSQFDVLNLIRTCSKLYNQVLPQLYKHIIIDVNFGKFDNQKYETNGRTYINSYFRFKRFIGTYVKKIDNDLSNIKIYKFECLTLLDSSIKFDLNLELQRMIKYLFNKLHNLTSLVWLDKGFRIKFLYSLKNKELINTLILNITSDSIKRNNSLLYDTNGKDHKIHQISNLNFPNLTSFQIKPFQNSKILLNIINNMLINQNDSNDVCSRLKTLSFSGEDLGSKTFNNIYRDIEQSILNEDIMECIFEKSKIKYLNNLTSLSISDISVNETDANYLINSINLKNLKFLQLSRIKEYTSNVYGDITNTIDTLNSNFLTKIAPFLNNLTHLSLGICQITNLIPQFLKKLARNNNTLKVLDLSVHFHPNLSFLIVNKFRNLEKLSLEIYDPDRTRLYMNLDEEFFEGFESLNLKSLRINSALLSSRFMELTPSQKSLEYLEIIDSNNADSSYSKVGSNRRYMYEDVSNVQAFGRRYLNLNPNLKFINYYDCLFQCNNSNLTVDPIDGLYNWFALEVRCLNFLDGWENEAIFENWNMKGYQLLLFSL